MKILIVINDYLNKSNGMSISTQRFVKEFKKLGHDVRIMSSNRYGELDYSLDVVKIPFFSGIIEKEGYTFAKVNKKVIKEAVAWADVVHLEDPFFVCRRASIEAKKLRKPITGTFHLYPENITYALHMGNLRIVNRWIMHFFFRSVFNRCDYVHCPTREVEKRLIHYRVRSKTEVITNGIDDFFLDQPRSRAFDGTLNVLSVGRYAPEKNQKVIIKAVARSKYCDKINLTIAGKGPIEKKLRALSDKLGVEVNYGFLSHEKLREIMLDSDIYIHGADVEVEGMSCMEAFGCGCIPIISDSRLSSTKSFALHKCNLFRHDNARSLSKKIDYFYENSDLLEEQSEEYMQYAGSMHVSMCAEKLADLMCRAMEEKNGNAL